MKKMKRQRGVALLYALLALLLLSAMAAGLMFMAQIETSVNGNYRTETRAYYAARAGVQEARDRLRLSNGVLVQSGYITTPDPVSIFCTAGGSPDGCQSNTTGLAPNELMPVGSPGGVLYLKQSGVDPTVSGPYADDELCEAYPGVNGMMGRPAVGAHCYVGSSSTPSQPAVSTSLAGGGTYSAGFTASTNWYTQTPSVLTSSVTDNNGNWSSADAMDYKWTRITVKDNESFPGTLVDSQSGTVQCPNSGGTYSNACFWPVCYDGYTEYIVNPGATPPANTCGGTVGPSGKNGVPVYIITSLAVTASGTRRMVESEVAKALFPNVQATLTFDGAGVNLTPPTSNPPTISGCDAGEGFSPDGNGGCTCGSTSSPVTNSIGFTSYGYNAGTRTCYKDAGHTSAYPGCSSGGNKPAFGTLGNPSGSGSINGSGAGAKCSNGDCSGDQNAQIIADNLVGAGSPLTAYNGNSLDYNSVIAGDTGLGIGPVPTAPGGTNPWTQDNSGSTTAGCATTAMCFNPAQTDTSPTGVPGATGIVNPSNPCSSTNPCNIQTAAVQNVTSAMGNLNTVAGLTQMVNNIAQIADYKVPAGSSISSSQVGTQSAPVVTVAYGDVSVSNSLSGYGILVVEGNLTINGTWNWNGLVLVVGEGSITQNGRYTINGGILMSSVPLKGALCGTATYPWGSPGCGQPDPQNSNYPGAVTYKVSGGGNSSINYDSCANDQLNNFSTYHVVAWREVSY